MRLRAASTDLERGSPSAGEVRGIIEPGSRHILGEREPTGRNDRVQEDGPRPLRPVLVIPDVCQRQRRRWMPPTAIDEKVEVQLPFHRAGPGVVTCACARISNERLRLA